MIGVRAACLAACLGCFPGGSQAEEASKPKTTLLLRGQGLRALTFGPNGKCCHLGCMQGCLWGLTAGKAKATFKGVWDGASDLLKLSPNGRWLAHEGGWWFAPSGPQV